MIAAGERRRGQHGPSPLSERTRRRLLRGLLDRAEAGEVMAAVGLLVLGAVHDQVQQVAPIRQVRREAP